MHHHVFFIRLQKPDVINRDHAQVAAQPGAQLAARARLTGLRGSTPGTTPSQIGAHFVQRLRQAFGAHRLDQIIQRLRFKRGQRVRIVGSAKHHRRARLQIGQRAQGYAAGDFQWGVDQGFRLVQAEQCWHTSLAPLMAEVRQQMGDGPVYLSFDIDSLDPIWAPGTGTPEVGGLTSIQALEIVRGCRGLNLIGADLVEVSPPYDVSGNTSQLAANLLYEMLCVLPGVKYA